MELKNTLKDLLKQHNMTVTELSAQTDIPQSSIRTWLQGASPRSLDDVRTVARFFKVSPTYLLWKEFENSGTSVDGVPVEDFFKGWLLVDIKKAVPDNEKSPSKKSKKKGVKV